MSPTAKHVKRVITFISWRIFAAFCSGGYHRLPCSGRIRSVLDILSEKWGEQQAGLAGSIARAGEQGIDELESDGGCRNITSGDITAVALLELSPPVCSSSSFLTPCSKCSVKSRGMDAEFLCSVVDGGSPDLTHRSAWRVLNVWAPTWNSPPWELASWLLRYRPVCGWGKPSSLQEVLSGRLWIRCREWKKKGKGRQPIASFKPEGTELVQADN